MRRQIPDTRLLNSFPDDIDSSNFEEVVIDIPARQSTPPMIAPSEARTVNPAVRQRWKDATARVTRYVKARNRWHSTVRTVITMKKLLHYSEEIKDKDPDDPRDRFYAAVQLTIYFKGEGDIAPKLLHVRRILQETSLGENLWDEGTRMGEKFYDFLTPSKMYEHVRWFTTLFTILLIGVYSYMCADYRNYRELSYGPHIGSALGEQFDFNFLDSWYGFQAFAIHGGERSRWFVSLLEHDGLQHIAANLCLFLVVAGDLEHKYGTTRIVIISFFAGLGGNLFSAVADDGCNILVGASGLIFGLVGFWIADLLINFHFVRDVLTRSLLAGCFFLFFIITVFSNAHVSNWCHLGGFLGGVFPGMLVLPKLGRQRLEAALTYVGLIGLVLFFTILPCIAYFVVFPKLTCSSDLMF